MELLQTIYCEFLDKVGKSFSNVQQKISNLQQKINIVEKKLK
jgi:cell division septum initiation protein DivIVA